MDYIAILSKDLENGFKKSDLERLIGLPQNHISGIIKGKKKLSRQSEIKIEKWDKSVKPDPLNLPKFTDAQIDDILETGTVISELSLDQNGQVKSERIDPKSEKAVEIMDKIETANPYNFVKEKWFDIKKYTKHPENSKPKDKWQIAAWQKEKVYSDNEIKLGWIEYQKNN